MLQIGLTKVRRVRGWGFLAAAVLIILLSGCDYWRKAAKIEPTVLVKHTPTVTIAELNPDQSTLDVTDADGASGGRINGLEVPLETARSRGHPAPESVSSHIRLASPPSSPVPVATLQPAYPYSVRLRHTTLLRQAPSPLSPSNC